MLVDRHLDLLYVDRCLKIAQFFLLSDYPNYLVADGLPFHQSEHELCRLSLQLEGCNGNPNSRHRPGMGIMDVLG